MFSRRGFLGQVGVTPQAGFGPPFGIFSPGIPSAPVLNRSGSPLFSEEIRSPQRAELERHCYHCPDGSTQSLTIDEARAMGCEATDSSECESPRTAYPAVMGQPHVVGPGSPPAGGPPSVSSQRLDLFPQVFLPNPYAYPPSAPSRVVCRIDKKRTQDEGQDVFICEPEVPETPTYSYPVIWLRQMGWF